MSSSARPMAARTAAISSRRTRWPTLEVVVMEAPAALRKRVDPATALIALAE
jgi:hypothetical protein